ncbi:hypothetical protein OEZ86_000668 [Tetradesmus obliquus]|nr:hypothetical protein OEZ86_000668 [Tetradesmus obliquus]
MIRRRLLNLVGSVAAQLSPTAGQQLACPAAEAAALTSAHRVLAASLCWGSQQPFASILGFHQQQQQLHTSVCSAAGSSQTPQHYVQIGRIGPAAGSRKTAIRWGRGNGSDRGTYCGRGIKGQKARKGGGKPHILFDGGQKQLKKYPKVWVTPSSPVLFRQVGLSKVLRWAQLGLLDTTQAITMKDLRDSGCVSKTIRWGVELVANGTERVEVPLHLQVSSASPTAQKLVQAAGGSVTRVYYTRLGLRALLKPEKFEEQGRALPQAVRAWPPRDNGKYDTIGQLPPATQLPQAALPVAAAALGSS